MIQVELVEMIFDADADSDEAVFARLFRSNMAEHEAARRSAGDDARKADHDRSLGTRRTW